MSRKLKSLGFFVTTKCQKIQKNNNIVITYVVKFDKFQWSFQEKCIYGNF